MHVLVAVVAIGLDGGGTTAFAQTAEGEATEPGQLAEVVVTAEKREESEQKTPISMSVISAEEINRAGIVDLATLAANDPSVNFGSSGAEGYLTVRGVSSHDVTEIGDPAVPVVIDGFTTIRPYTLASSLYDLARIEVLRGPQGTLYGRNAAGGLVNVVSQKPTKEFSASGSAEFGNFNTNNFTAVVNMPVSDSLQLRISGASRRHDGYRDILPSDGEPASRGDDEDSRSGRVQAAYSPTDTFHAWLLFQTTQLGGSGVAEKGILFVPNPDQVNHPGDISHAKPDLGDTRSFPLYGPLSQNVDDKVTKWQFTYSGLPARASITYLGGYDNMQWHHVTPVPNLFGQPITTPVAFFQNEFPKTVSHELRLTSDSRGVFVWQTGVYYFEERSTNLFSYGQANPFSTQAANLLSFSFPLVDTKSKAAFGQGSFNINDESKVTAGLRYSKDTKSRNGVFNLDAFGIFGIPQEGSSESSKTTYHLGYDWSPSQRNLVYAKFDTGYKPGGFTTCQPYEPEEVKTVEIGSKNRFSGNTIQVNGAAFYNKYTNQQVAALSAGCVSGTVVQNAGQSKIYGLEASLDALLGEADKVDLGLTLLHARFDSFLASPTNGNVALSSCPATETIGGVTNCQLSGNMLPQAPNVTVAAGYEHNWKVSAAAALNLRLEARYQSKQYLDAFNFGDSAQDGYGLANAYLAYSHDKWKMTLYGRNLTDKVYLTNAEEVTTGGAHYYRYGFGAPRTFGVRFDASL
jgi:iron complex outermembrane receptor protein